MLLHISEIAWERVEKVEKYLNIGDITKVKYMGIDSRTRKQKVSRKILLERPKKKDWNETFLVLNRISNKKDLNETAQNNKTSYKQRNCIFR